MEQEKIRKFFDGILKDDVDIQLDNIKQFLNCFKLTQTLKIFAQRAEKNSLVAKPRTIQTFFNDFAKAYFHNETHWRDIPQLEMRVRILIIDYYFPNYIEEYFLPYMLKNRSGDIARAEQRKNRDITFYSNLDDPHHVKMRVRAIHQYNSIIRRYKTDWSEELGTVKLINQQIKENEAQSQLPPRIH